jgi:hypothetical protein
MNDNQVRVYFDNIHSEIIKELDLAYSSIKICVAWITIDLYINALRKAKNRGVVVDLICNSDRYSQDFNESEFDSFHRVRSYFSNGLMHNKFCIIDNEILITGSYNWTKNAAKHYENIIILKNNFHVIKQYLHQFEDFKPWTIERSNFLRSKENNKCKYPWGYNGRLCNAITYNILISAYNNEYNKIKLGLWRICNKNEHIDLIEEFIEECYDDYDEEDDPDAEYNKKAMLIQFKRERKLIDNHNVYEYYNSTYPVQALAYIQASGGNQRSKHEEQEPDEINIYWRNMFYRKLIPDALYIDEIIEWGT